MNNYPVPLQIKKVKLIKVKSGRYGLKFNLKCKLSNGSIKFFYYLWLGNYKDFQSDDQRKNAILWRLFHSKIDHMGIAENDWLNLSKIKNKEFLAILEFVSIYPDKTVSPNIDIKEIIKPI